MSATEVSATSVEVPAPLSTITDLLAVAPDTSPFGVLIPRPLEPIGVPSLFYPPYGSFYHIGTTSELDERD